MYKKRKKRKIRVEIIYACAQLSLLIGVCSDARKTGLAGTCSKRLKFRQTRKEARTESEAKKNNKKYEITEGSSEKDV